MLDDAHPSPRDISQQHLRLARSGAWTLLALLLGVVYLVCLAVALKLLLPEANAEGWRAATWWLVCAALTEQGLNVVELFCRHRAPHPGRTLPLILLPGGRLLRMLLILATILPLVLLRLVTYFVWFALAAPLHLALARLGVSRNGRLLDAFDELWARPDHLASRFYNTLHFTKIESNATAFTLLFNLPLGLWCLNH